MGRADILASATIGIYSAEDFKSEDAQILKVIDMIFEHLGSTVFELKMLVERIFIVLKRFFGVPSFFNDAIADGIYNLLSPDKAALRGIQPKSLDDFELCFDFG